MYSASLALVLDDAFEQADVFGFLPLLAQGGVAVAAHTDGDQVLGILGAFHAFGEELIQDLAVFHVVPLPVGAPPAHPFLVVAGHRFVMGRAHDDAHLVRRTAVFGVIGIESPVPHGRPHEIGPQTQQELENTGVEAVVAVIGAVGVLHPRSQARGLVVEEDAAVADGGLGNGVGPRRHRQVLAVRNGHIGPVIPRRDAHLLGNLVDAVDGPAHVRAGDNQGVFVDDLQDISLVLPLERAQVDASFRAEPLDQRAVRGAGVDGARPRFRGLGAAYAGEILAQRLRGDPYARQVGRVRDHGRGHPVPHEAEPSGGLSSGGDARVVDGEGRNTKNKDR